MTTPNSQLASRADLAIADLSTNGGILLPEQANRFIDFILEEPTMLPQVRTVRMNSPEVKINRMGFATRILRVAPTVGSENDGGDNDRYLRTADRAKPTTSQITITTKELMAEVRIPYEAVEDNIEGRSMEEHVMRLIAQRVALDLEEYSMWGDTAAVGDAYLALANGWLKRCTANIFNNASAGVSPAVFTSAMLNLPQKYLKYLPQMRGYISLANTIRYRSLVSARATGYGDSALQQAIPLVAHGLTLEGVPSLAMQALGATGLVTFPQNLILGIRRDISVETDRDIRSREYIIVVTLRVGTQVDDVNAAVKITNL